MGVTTTPQESKRTDKKHPCSHTVTHSFANNSCSLYDQIFKRKGHSTPTCIRSTSRTATVLSEKLGSPNKGQVDPRNSKGLQNRIQREPQAAGQTSPNAIQSITRRPHTTGGIRASNKRGNQGDCRGIPSRGREFLFDPFLGPKKRWRPEAGHQPESPKPVCHSATLQDGGHSHPKNPLETRRLASENRPQGRLLCHPNSGRKQEISKLFDGGQKLPIHLSPLRPCISSMGLYQDPQAGSSSRSRARGETSDLYRRHASHGGIQGESGRSGFRSDVPPTVPRVHNKHEKIGAGPNPISRVPRLSGQLLNNGVKPPNRQTKKDQGGVTEVTRGGANYKPRPFKTNRQNECCQSGDSPLSSVLQTPTNGPDGVLESLGSKLRDYTHPIPREQGGINLVGYPDEQMEWTAHPSQGAGPGDRIGCFNPRLGSVLPEHKHGWPLVCAGKDQPHQLPRTASSYAGTENIREEPNGGVSLAQDRQHHSSGLHQQPRGHSLQDTGYPNKGPVDVVSGKEHSHPSTTPTRCPELQGGHRVQNPQGSVRLEPGQGHFLKNKRAIWPNRSGPICIQTDQSVPSLFQLAARSICRGDRCLPTGLVINTRLCQSSVEYDTSSHHENTITESRCDPSNPNMEVSAMVCNPSLNDGRLATPTTNSTLSPTEPSTSRVEYLRQRLDSQGLSGEAAELILSSWRTKTNKSYDSLFGHWSRWCNQRKADPFSGPVSNVVNFLASLYQEGYQYNSIGAYRSAISSVHDKVDGLPVGQHPLVSRLIKGIFNTRPPIPRYTSTWDVQTVLSYLESLSPSSNLSLKLLTLKTVFLMAITRPSRSVDLAHLDCKRLRSDVEGISFLPNTLAKQSRQGKPIEEFFFPTFPSNITLCPVNTLRVYLTKTKPLRGDESKLFISFIKPHKAVTSSTIARWLRTILELSGIDSSIFGAHSTRSASTSAAARGGVTLEDILKAANWSSESVFQKFYHKKVDKTSFGISVINQNSSE